MNYLQRNKLTIANALSNLLEFIEDFGYTILSKEIYTPTWFERDHEIENETVDILLQGSFIPIYEYDFDDEPIQFGVISKQSIEEGLNLLQNDDPGEFFNILAGFVDDESLYTLLTYIVEIKKPIYTDDFSIIDEFF